MNVRNISIATCHLHNPLQYKHLGGSIQARYKKYTLNLRLYIKRNPPPNLQRSFLSLQRTISAHFSTASVIYCHFAPLLLIYLLLLFESFHGSYYVPQYTLRLSRFPSKERITRYSTLTYIFVKTPQNGLQCCKHLEKRCSILLKRTYVQMQCKSITIGDKTITRIITLHM